jgi:hypothetical protein
MQALYLFTHCAIIARVLGAKGKQFCSRHTNQSLSSIFPEDISLQGFNRLAIMLFKSLGAMDIPQAYTRGKY